MANNRKQHLYGEQTLLTMENMSFSKVPLLNFPIYIHTAAKVKKSCALANNRAGLLSGEKAFAIMEACDRISGGQYDDEFPVDVYHGGGGIGINMNLNEVISNLAGEAVGTIDDVNLSQSTSDVCHTSLRLSLITLLEETTDMLNGILKAIDELASSFSGHDTIARTCWQDGLRVSASALPEGTAAALRRQIPQIEEWKKQLLKVNLGWTVIGTGSGASDSYRDQILKALKEVTGRDVGWRESHYDSAEYPDDLAGISALTNRIGQILAKFARDIRLLSSGPETGLGEINVPAVQAGSSFFPGKVNPVVAEMMIQCSMLIFGRDAVIQNALGQGEIHLNVWEELMGFQLMESLSMLNKAGAKFLEKCVSGITLNPETCEQYACARIPLVTSCKDEYGYQYLSDWVHRDGYEQVAASLKKMREEAYSEKKTAKLFCNSLDIEYRNNETTE